MDSALIKTGHGYEGCTAFDGYDVIAEPLGNFGREDRDSRVFNKQSNGNGGTCYGSHTLKLAKDNLALYLLVQHGSGREVWRVPKLYDGGALLEHILSMDPRAQYALLYTIYKTASYARYQAQSETRALWAQAFVDKRLKKRRATKNRAARVEIEPAA